MTLVLRYAARSDRGLVRSNNQDSVYAGPRLLALADGMGGHAAGEVASKLVVAALAPLDDDEPGDDLFAQLRDSVRAGDAAIAETVAGDAELDGMGTTLTAVLFAGSKLGLVHVGDSRAYLMREGALSQITHDDTFVQSLLDEGRITEEEAEHHPQRNLLLRALTGNDVEPTLTIRESRAGDRYLLCSDGLSGVVSSETMTEAMRIPEPQRCADRLIELALKGGGPDNITCIVADVVDVDFGEDAPIVGGAAGDGSEQQEQPSSPAARASAAAATQQQPERPPEKDPDTDPGAEASAETERAPRRRWRWALGALAVVALLAVAALITRVWLYQQYYVSFDERGEVSIYQGVNSTVPLLDIPLHRLAERSCPEQAAACTPIYRADLSPAFRSQVGAGLSPNEDLQSARRTIDNLRSRKVLPPCPEQQPSSAPSGQTPSGETPSSAAQPTSAGSADPQPGVDCRRVSQG